MSESILSTPLRKQIDNISNGDDWYNVYDYGLIGDGVTDNTSALQTLINLIASKKKNATIFFPDANVYVFDGAFQEPSRANCIIKFPSVDISDKYFTITLRGYSKPSFSPSAYSTVPLPSATRLKTNKAVGTGTRPSFFGGTGPVNGPNGECSYVTVGFQDLIVITPPDPQITAINAQHFTNFHTKNVGVLAGESYGTLSSVEPTNSESYGVIHPDFSHGVYQRVEEILFILGYYNGIRIGENSVCDELEVWACSKGVIFDFSYGVSMIHKLSFGWVKNHLTWRAVHKVQISCVNIERWEYGYGNIPSRWYNFVSDVDDPSNLATGEIIFQAARASVGPVEGLFTTPPNSKLYTREMGFGDVGALKYGILGDDRLSGNITRNDAFQTLNNKTLLNPILKNATGIEISSITGLTSSLAAKQSTLISGTSIKTINGISLLGSGDISISGGGGGGTVDSTIIDGSTNAVSGNAVFDALALKSPLASPSFTGDVTATGNFIYSVTGKGPVIKSISGNTTWLLRVDDTGTLDPLQIV